MKAELGVCKRAKKRPRPLPLQLAAAFPASQEDRRAPQRKHSSPPPTPHFPFLTPVVTGDSSPPSQVVGPERVLTSDVCARLLRACADLQRGCEWHAACRGCGVGCMRSSLRKTSSKGRVCVTGNVFVPAAAAARWESSTVHAPERTKLKSSKGLFSLSSVHISFSCKLRTVTETTATGSLLYV